MELNVQIPALISVVTFLVVAVFQLLLASGFPLAEYSWGGKYKGVLPPRLRVASLLSAGILCVMAFILLSHTNVILVWVITIFMGINTLGNLASKSKKEKIVMTPLTSIAFLSCFLVAIFSA